MGGTNVCCQVTVPDPDLETRLPGAVGLACLEIRSRNEEGINSTGNRIYSLKFFYILLYRRRYFLFVSELF